MVAAYRLFPLLSIYRMVEWLGWQPLILIPVLTLVWTARRAYGLIFLLPGVTRCQGREGRRTPPPRFECLLRRNVIRFGEPGRQRESKLTFGEVGTRDQVGHGDVGGPVVGALWAPRVNADYAAGKIVFL